MKTAIFLDFDGVLNHAKSRAAKRCRFHDVKWQNIALEKDHLDLVDECVAGVLSLIKEYDSAVIVTSMWRIHAKREWFFEVFGLYGLQLAEDKLDVLPWEGVMETNPGERSLLIGDYLAEHPYDRFVMIDDTFSHYSINMDNLVHTDIATGFTPKHYELARSILERK